MGSTPQIAERMLRYAWRLYAGGEITTVWMRQRFGISKNQAHRDMQALFIALPVAANGPTIRGKERRVKLTKRSIDLLRKEEEDNDPTGK
jgi:hypothetical protein